MDLPLLMVDTSRMIPTIMAVLLCLFSGYTAIEFFDSEMDSGYVGFPYPC